MHRPLREESHGNFNAHEETHENQQGWPGLDPGTDPQALGDDDDHARGPGRRARPQAGSRRPDRGRRGGVRRRRPRLWAGDDPSRRARSGTRSRRTQVRPVRTLLDANALVAVILGQSAMELVRGLLREGNAAMAAPNVVEVYDIATRREGLPAGRVAEFVEPLFEGTIEQV